MPDIKQMLTVRFAPCVLVLLALARCSVGQIAHTDDDGGSDSGAPDAGSAQCNNAVLEVGEECDGDSCCSPDCKLVVGGECSGQIIPLRLDVGGVASTYAPLGVGVPLPQGKVESPDALWLVGRSQGVLPRQVSVRTRWPDGSIQWTWIDFLGDPRDEYVLRVMPHRGAPATTPAARVQVVESPESLVVDTGAARFEWTRAFASPTSVTLSGGPTFQGDGGGVFVVAHDNRRAVLGGAAANLSWRVEDSGPLRSVIRVEGSYVTSDGSPLASAILRYHFYAGQAWFSVDHTFVLTQDTDTLRFKQVALRFPWSGSLASQARFGVEGVDGGPGRPEARVPLPSANSQAWLLQDEYPHFAQTVSHWEMGSTETGQTKLQEGSVAAGWAEAADETSGLMVAIRDFAPQFPKELSADSRGVTAHLWSSRGGKQLDFRPNTLVDDYYGLDFVKGVESATTSDGLTPGWTVAKFRALNPSALGSARTHELVVAYYAATPPLNASAQLNAALQLPAVAIADPAWSMSSGTLWPVAPKDDVRFPDEEWSITDSWKEFIAWGRDFPMTGWIAWGAGSDNRFEMRGGKRYASFWRLRPVNSYQVTKHAWMLYLRSGERQYLDFAERGSRFSSDFEILHAGGGRDRKVKGLVPIVYYSDWIHLPLYWQGSGDMANGDSSGEPMSALRLAYFTRDRRWARDSIGLYADAIHRTWTLEGARGLHVPEVNLSMMLNAYQVTQDAALAAKIHEFFNAHADPDAFLGTNGAFLTAGVDPPVIYKPQRRLAVWIDYFDVFKTERARKTIIKATEGLYPFAVRVRSFAYQNVAPVYLLRSYGFTGNRDYLGAALAHLESGVAYRKALPGKNTWPGSPLAAPYQQAFPFFSVPHALAALAATPAPQPSVPYLVNLGNTPDTRIAVEKTAGVPVTLLLSIEYFEEDANPPPRVIEVRTAAGSTVQATIENSLSEYLESANTHPIRVTIPGALPAGSYFVSAGANRYQVLQASTQKVVLHLPSGGVLGFRGPISGPRDTSPNRTGFWQAQGKRCYFQVPAGRQSFTLETKVANQLQLFDATGADVSGRILGKSGAIIVTTEGKTGLWSFIPSNKEVWVRFVDVPPIVALGDPSRHFVPDGVR